MNLADIAIVLVEPSHPGNVGAVARSMKTMGLSDLVLVNPRKYPHVEASQRAAGADDVLDGARVFDNVPLALTDRNLVYGTSVRDRHIVWPTLDPRELAKKVAEHLGVEQVEATKVAIMFGRENSGLTNQELDLCHEQIRIPANKEYSSLNLASAVQIVAYELRMQCLLVKSGDIVSNDSNEEKVDLGKAQQRQLPATQKEKEGHFQHLEETLALLDFVKNKNSDKLMRKLTRLYNKASLSNEEIQILRGILTAVQTKSDN